MGKGSTHGLKALGWVQKRAEAAHSKDRMGSLRGSAPAAFVKSKKKSLKTISGFFSGEEAQSWRFQKLRTHQGGHQARLHRLCPQSNKG
jgi:hypothetical protein